MLAKDRHKTVVPADRGGIPKSLSSPVRRLLLDIKNGTLKGQAASKLAVLAIKHGDRVGRRYRLTSGVTEQDLAVLGSVAGADTTDAEGRSLPALPAGSLDCPVVQPENQHHCGYVSEHSTVGYIQEKLNAEEQTDADSDGTPDYIQKWANVADQAWEYYDQDLGMTPLSDVVHIDLTADLDGICASWPNTYIYCSAHFDPDSLDWLASHEMFHQFQWHYLPSALLVAPVPCVASLLNINPWMESTANWAAAHFVEAVLGESPSLTAAEAWNIGDFFTSVNEGLTSRGAGANGTMSGPRAYGAMPVVEFFSQQTSQEFVKNSFQALSPVFLDGYSQIGDALAVDGYSLNDMLTGVWLAMYTMCDPGEPDQWWRLRGDLVRGWCDAANIVKTVPGTPTARPSHEAELMWLHAAGQHQFSLARYGAGFIDFELDVQDNSAGTTLALEFDSDQVEMGDETAVLGWKDTPGGELCQTQWGYYPSSTGEKTAFTVKIPKECKFATLVLVNVRASDPEVSSEVAAPVSWALFSTGAVISNGTLSLGVNADGSLGLGLPEQAVCRAGRSGLARTTPEVSGLGAGLIDEATQFDAIRDAWHLPCQNPDLGEAWAVVDPNNSVDGSPEVWTKPALDVPDAYPGAIQSFSYTASEATSVVPLGNRYMLVQHWHPSTANDRVYQLDVTIQPNVSWGALPLTFRRIVPLEIDGWNLEEIPDYVSVTRALGDGVSDATANLFWDWSGDTWPGFIDDPRVPLPHYGPQDITDWYEKTRRGLAIDVEVGSGSRTTPNAPDFSLFYGFADSTTQADGTLGDLGVTTSALAQVPASDTTHVVLVGLRDTP
ncbi:MAG: hypothetical protein LCH96_14945 [Actinobacteria bacterium]|nr:hypothetical protein [Actinomycetota bacterium]